MVLTSLKQCTRIFQRGSCSKMMFNSFHTCGTQYFHESGILHAMPMKRKVKLDPRIILEKEQKKRRKIESELKKLEKTEGTRKPIDEFDSQRKLKHQLSERVRRNPELPREEVLQRIQLEKDWCQHSSNQYRLLCQRINQATKFSAEALIELRKESEELYVQAIQEDPSLISYSKTGPTSTPAIKNYIFPDGEYNDVTRAW
ncbi:39S ribosomal protein L40, mitochondrial-like [Ostrea edulis]|uniref:39S ribosomal protein L40, mitochondrial-like n=1 Tax=Ostrea edulis TaxID=37623 RepID=UPI002094C1EE|nr:39S ribosomal protein L40, mitochondrial-like [Ostrea edulis]